MTTPTAMAAPHSLSLDDAKQAARVAAYAIRATCDPALGSALADFVPGLLPNGAIVAGFWPLPGEIDIRPLLTALHEAGHPLALPHTPPRGQPLSFRQWHPGAPLQPGRFGTQIPTGRAITPDVLLVPLLAFDHHGHRLGYGGGYYDRTIAALPGVATIGCAFAAQQLPAVPCGPTDMKLDRIATERGLILAET